VVINETTTITTAGLIEVSLSLVKVTETEEDDQRRTLAGSLETNSHPHKQGTSDGSSNSKRTEEPAKAVFMVSRHKYKVPNSHDSNLELGDNHDDQLHVRWGALVKAYSSVVMEVNISPMPTRVYGPETTQTLMGAASG